MSAIFQMSAQMSQGSLFLSTQTKLDVPRNSHNFQYNLKHYCFWLVFEPDCRFREGRDSVSLGHWIYTFFPINDPKR